MLKPRGTLHFVEHGLAPDEKVQRWQHRLDPLQQRLFGGCHLNRPIADLLTRAGFMITEVDAQGRLVASITFDVADRAAADAEMRARYEAQAER